MGEFGQYGRLGQAIKQAMSISVAFSSDGRGRAIGVWVDRDGDDVSRMGLSGVWGKGDTIGWQRRGGVKGVESKDQMGRGRDESVAATVFTMWYIYSVYTRIEKRSKRIIRVIMITLTRA